MPHPIRSSELHEDVERWTERLLEETGSATVEVTIVFNIKDRRFLAYRVGGASSRKYLTAGEETP